MSGIDEYFGYSEPVKKEEPKEEKSIQERVNAFRGSSEFALGKSAEYFEETYKKIVPEPNPELDKEIEEMFYESPIEPQVNLSTMSIEELEALAEQKTQEIEVQAVINI